MTWMYKMRRKAAVAKHACMRISKQLSNTFNINSASVASVRTMQAIIK